MDIGDLQADLAEGRTGPSLGRGGDLRVGRHRADRQGPVRSELDPLQLVQAVQIDEDVGGGGARLHHVDQGLAACEGAGSLVPRQDREGLGDGRRLRILDLPQ